MKTPAEILDFWFAVPQESPDYLQSRSALWFGGTPAVDEEIRQKFGPTVDAAASGLLGSWINQANSCLALIILLDQFALNIFRDQAKGFALSDRTIPFALHSLEKGFNQNTHPLYKAFFYLPLEHAEHISLQKKSVQLFGAIETETRETFWHNWAIETKDFAERHQRVVERFGRFPHRNQALGRISTPEEIEFLKAGAPF